MARRLVLAFAFLSLWAAATPGRAQQDPLQGRWEGMVRSIQGERKATVSFKKEGETYSGAISGVSGTTEIPFKEIKRDGEKVTAVVQIDAPQGPVTVNFDFVLKGETLDGKGEVNLGAQKLAFTYDLKRVGDLVAKKDLSPEQKLDYFVGQWRFEMVARDSPLGPGGELKGQMSFDRVLDGKFLESRFEAGAGKDVLRASGFIGFDSASKLYTYFEHRNNGIVMFNTGTWTGPGIRLEAAPVQVKGQTFRLRRAISVVSENTFTLVEEFSQDGGPFQRLGNGTFTKVGAAGATANPK
jgi:Protein of unknown function (DUF1579)